MPEWEYAILALDFSNYGEYQAETKLCQFGAMGWELVAIDSSNRAYFKRPKR